MPIHLKSYAVEVFLAGAWSAIDPDAITDAQSTLNISANQFNPLAPGDDTASSGSVTALRSATDFTWFYTPIRITYTFDGAPNRTFVGIINDRSSDGAERTLTCRGIDAKIRTTKLHSPLFARRPVASRTTPTSIDDPANPSYQAGVLNWIMWQCGGRPYQQASGYLTALFYYNFDASVLDPRYMWVAGEDAWAEAQKLCAASGGRLYVSDDGVVIYRNPLQLNATATGTGLDPSTFGSIEERESADQAASTAVVPYMRRYLLQSQEVLDDSVPRIIRPGDSITVTLTPRWPIFAYDGFALTITDSMGLKLTQDATTGYTFTATTAAQLVTLVIMNHRSTPVTLRKITGTGSPLVPGEAAEARAGSGTPERAQPANEFVQDEVHARRLATMLLDLYTPTPTRTITDAIYDPYTHLGDVKAVTDPDLGLSATPHLLTARSDDNGEVVTYTAVSTAHLLRLDEVFLMDTIYGPSDTRKLSY